MRVFRTKVFSKVDRESAARVLCADLAAGRRAVFRLADRERAKVSGTARLTRMLAPDRWRREENAPRHLVTVSSFGAPTSLDAVDVSAFVHGVGARLPCDHGWVLTTDDPEALAPPRLRGAIDQNTFLCAAGNALAYGVFGTVVLSVREIHIERALTEIEADDATAPFGSDSWSYLHFVLDEAERRRGRSIGEAEAEAVRAIRIAVASRGSRSPTVAGGARVPLKKIAVKHFARFGYELNARESDPGRTAVDKVTARGNVIRITASTSGFGVLVPHVEARVLGSGPTGASTTIVAMRSVVSEDELRALLAAHEPELRMYEERVASARDESLGACPPDVTALIRRHRVRAIL